MGARNFFLVAVATAHASPSPPAPIPLLTAFEAFVTVRSASPYGPVYSNGTEALDSHTGNVMRNITSYIEQPLGKSFYLRLCTRNISFYMDATHKCRAEKPVGCVCVFWKEPHGCKEWASPIYPTEVPVGATLRGNKTVDNVPVDEYEWQAPPFGGVRACVTKTDPRYVVRFVEARMQNDYKLHRPGARPAESVFSVPHVCKQAEAQFLAASSA